MAEAVKEMINSSISGMLPNNTLFGASNASSHHNYSGFQAAQNASFDTEEDLYGQDDLSSRGLMIAFHSVVAAVIFVGNLLVLIVISKSQDLQTPSNIYVFNLAITDILVSVSNVFKVIELIRPEVFNGAFLCAVIRMGTVVFSSLLSIFLMAGIAVDRLMAVFDPFKYQQNVTVIKTVFAISIMWVYAFSITYLPHILGYHNWVPNSDCYIANTFTSEVILLGCINFFVVTLVIYMMYAAMFKIAAGHMQKIAATMVGNSSQETAKIKMHLKAGKTLLLVTGTFSLCWLPFMFNLINISYTDPFNPGSVPRQVQKYLSIILFFNCSVNPIIYARKLSGFRSEFFRVLTCYRYEGVGNNNVVPAH